jgi:ribosome biogenesis GTPase
MIKGNKKWSLKMTTTPYTYRIYTNENNQYLLQMGWTSHFQTQLENFCNDKFIPARVVGVRKNNFRVSNGKREWLATVAGRLKHHSDCIFLQKQIFTKIQLILSVK